MGEWRGLLLVLALGVVLAATAALQPWPLKILVDFALGDVAAPAFLETALAGIGLEITAPVLIVAAAGASLLIFALGAGLEAALNWNWSRTGQRLVVMVAQDMFKQLLRLSLPFHARRTTGDALNRLTGDAWCVYTVTESLLIAPVQHLVTLAAVGAVAWQLDHGLTLTAFAAVPVASVLAFVFGARTKRRERQSREAQSRLFAFVHQTIEAIPLVQAFGSERRNRNRFLDLSGDIVEVAQRKVLVNQSYTLLSGLATTAALALVLYIGGLRVLSGALSIGSLLVFIAYVRSMNGAVSALLRTYLDLKSAQARAERVFEILDADEAPPESPTAKPLPPIARSGQPHIRFAEVSFGYEPGRPVLHDIDLAVRTAEKVALVGPTGAGKTTLMSLIPRFFDPWAGVVSINGQDVRQATLASVRAQVALVLQQPLLLPISVADNIAFGRPSATRAEIVRAAEKANADAFIRQLPDGYDTVLSEHAVTLSGGERQRLSIARAILRDAPILIMDEPTSALDPRTEAEILQALETLTRHRTCLVIAHRLSTVRDADRILVLQNGTIRESGRHQELLAVGGLYARLYALQDLQTPLRASA